VRKRIREEIEYLISNTLLVVVFVGIVWLVISWSLGAL
jgi:hypothetical protein